MKDPGTFLTGLDITLTSALGTGEPAVMDSAHLTWVNHEAYFFASVDERDVFAADPIPWCGWVTDPVSKHRFRPSAESPHVMHLARPFYFAADSTRDVFAAQPDSFFLPVLRMVERS